MKKTISAVLVLVLLFSMGMQVTAAPYNEFLGIDEAEYDMDAYYAALWDNYNHNMHGLLWNYVCGEEYYVYTQAVNKVGNDGWIQFASRLTEEELTRERYTEILVNLMAMMDYNVSDLIEEQVSADSLKTFSDYTVDVAGILVQTISLNTAFGDRITDPMKKITTALNLTWGGAEFTISTIETFEYLDRLVRQYENHSIFLSAIEENATDSELQEAAKDLRSLADMTFYYKVDAVTKVSGDFALYLGRTVFFETLVLDYMANDASVLGLSEADMAAIELLKTAYTYLGTLPLAADLGVFAADMLIGISNILNRYNEMRALVEVRNAVIIKLTELRNDITTATELEKIDSLCKLMKNLIYINYRGEYCSHEMLASDAQAFSLAIKINGQVRTINEVFENAKENTRTFVECLNIFVFPILDLYSIHVTDENLGSGNISNELTTGDLTYVMRKEVIEFPLSDGTIFYRNIVEYPLFQGTTAVEGAVNDRYSDIIASFRENTTDYNRIFHDTYDGDVSKLSLPFYDDIKAEITYCKNGVISIREYHSMWEDGAHVYSYTKGICYDTSTGAILEENDIIVGSEEERDQLLTQLTTKEIGSALVLSKEYYFTEDGLCLSLSVGAAGLPVEIIIPFTDPNSYIISAKAALGLSSNEQTGNRQSEYSYYINTLQSISANDEYDECLLFDIDNNGIDELIVMYVTDIDNGYGDFPHMVCEAYTIDNGTLAILIDTFPMYAQAGGPSGSVSIVQIDGIKYLAITTEGGETGGYPTNHRSGEWYLYRIDRAEASKSIDVTYDYTVDVEHGDVLLYDESFARINGNKVSYREYERWRGSLETLKTMDGFTDDWRGNDDGVNINRMIEQLKK